MPWSDTSITVAVPNLAPGDYPVVVHTKAGASNPVTFTVQAPPVPPTLDLVQPGSAMVGDTIVLTGSHFGDGTGSMVTIGGAPASSAP